MKLTSVSVHLFCISKVAVSNNFKYVSHFKMFQGLMLPFLILNLAIHIQVTYYLAFIGIPASHWTVVCRMKLYQVLPLENVSFCLIF